ncbi:Light-harvesting complex I LH38 protein [Symbiodinium microadriaticum]|uniref:Light-harvesting complex I LH38 protein n=3 Tax=Symbiodinium TaxID=2949 RepID=A0A1Q9D7R9_SYMMI|nr:Light-harvesting complex I LH38 protein [Symbiodinium microadriaticum]
MLDPAGPKEVSAALASFHLVDREPFQGPEEVGAFIAERNARHLALRRNGPGSLCNMDIDLLNPDLKEEKVMHFNSSQKLCLPLQSKHKLKRMIQSPNSFFMDVKCPGCLQGLSGAKRCGKQQAIFCQFMVSGCCKRQSDKQPLQLKLPLLVCPALVRSCSKPFQAMPAMSKLSFVAASAAAATAATTFVGVPQPVSRPVALRGTQQRSATGAGLGGALGLGLAGLGLASLSVVPTARASVVRCAYDASQGFVEKRTCFQACGYALPHAQATSPSWPFTLNGDLRGSYCQDGCTKEDFDRRRAVELKHGRLCMVATIGMVWPDIFGKFDGYLSPSQNLKFADVPSGIAAVTKVPLEGWLQILLVAGLIETQLLKDQSFGGFGYAKYGAEPGNFGTGYWGRKIQDPAERKLKLTTELNNGRLAMIAMSGMLIQNGLTGQSPIEQLTAGHISPFNDGQGFFAFDPSAELGACPPLGYWDPFGMMAFQDEEKFRRNRELELKHGRICMVATIGMIVPDLFGRFGGYLSPSMDLKFSDIPCTIEAIYKVPTFGWLQIFALAGAIEAKNQAFPENYGYPPFWGRINTLEPEEKQKKLLAEINNGRLAMVAMAAIVAQNGATGQSLVEQFTTGNLNPFVGGYAQREGDAKDKVALRAEFGSGAGKSTAIPWDPIPEGLSNDIFNNTYVGDVGFDPAGFAKNQRLLPWYREAELAHGRVCMLAVLGYTVQTSGAKFEPFITRYPTDSADPLKAATQVPIVGWLQIIVVIALSELWRYENVISKYSQGVQPGDLGWNPTAPVSSPRPKWFGPTFTAAYQPEEWNNMKLREIKHCRLAMVGFFFMVLRNASTGEGPSLLPNLTTAEFQSSVGDFIPRDI